MGVFPERWHGRYRHSQPVVLMPARPRFGFWKWYRRARGLGWPRWNALMGAFTFGRQA